MAVPKFDQPHSRQNMGAQGSDLGRICFAADVAPTGPALEVPMRSGGSRGGGDFRGTRQVVSRQLIADFILAAIIGLCRGPLSQLLAPDLPFCFPSRGVGPLLELSAASARSRREEQGLRRKVAPALPPRAVRKDVGDWVSGYCAMTSVVRVGGTPKHAFVEEEPCAACVALPPLRLSTHCGAPPSLSILCSRRIASLEARRVGDPCASKGCRRPSGYAPQRNSHRWWMPTPSRCRHRRPERYGGGGGPQKSDALVGCAERSAGPLC